MIATCPPAWLTKASPKSIAQPKAVTGNSDCSKTTAIGSMQIAAEAVLQIMMRTVPKRLRSRPIARI
ncbi:hypothetical protein N184_14850 [Sinorhizobium sp. GL28]|nr:hypothetical protein N184_14850 [Sinorhizobium sp. GL28]